MPAFEAFHRLNGYCRVPRPFVVPSDERWPTLLWGLKLGIIVKGIRRGTYSTQVSHDRARLVELGFVWDTYEFEWSERIMPALETFHRLHGHCRVPVSFVVPLDENWPRLLLHPKLHGLKLGFALAGVRRRGYYFDQIARSMDALEAIEFDLMTPVTKKWEDRVEPMLATFEQLHGHRDVPRDFVVPSSSPWIKKDWGIQLGNG
ncbi:hypothetical protein PHYSODRAFT_530680 [Phytophthora sojae]|uniref:Helicase-associated domain-containing protein n=1 Tax=Phytophthora sojae (strain P6497) TaxID=1094619 RepID=G5ACJ0_PHYSP|nr:hypothetical protein PHYSODRAFT_530680 [Phytophthora sojae]EGZ07064.1 hypothetical protein PHYSODRAFT_530680 [Phytophthora sojae]|eukprot:XP_009537828.1 hypothetical protein PHYSODRAFT_530680 [Phytophthora sojae]